MSIPPQFSVMGQTFTVSEAECIHAPDVELRPGRDVMGLTDSTAQTVTLREDMGFDVTREIYLHECLHAVIAVALGHEAMTDEHEETIVDRLAPALLLFIRDNPHVLAFLRERE